MNPIRTEETMTPLGAPIGWDEKRDGTCDVLFVKINGMEMASFWQPSAEEIARIVAGEPIRLTIVSRAHPPVRIEVG